MLLPDIVLPPRTPSAMNSAAVQQMTEAPSRAAGWGEQPMATICTASSLVQRLAASLASCTASSRVGATTSTLWRASYEASSRTSAGNRKASDLPLPVSACSSILSPVSARGIAACWMGVGAEMPRSASAACMWSGSAGMSWAKLAAVPAAARIGGGGSVTPSARASAVTIIPAVFGVL